MPTKKSKLRHPHRTLAKLKRRSRSSRQTLALNFPHIVKKLSELELDLKDLRRHSARMLSAAALAGLVFVAAPRLQPITPSTNEQHHLSPDELSKNLQEELQTILPKHVGAIPPEIEEQAHEIIQRRLGLNASAELDGNHLNASFGYMGAEQHLPRYPGDTIDQHDDLQFKGITSGTGAFGYFAQSAGQMTPEKIQAEKYYVAVQTLYLPNWNTDSRTLKNWYAFRKVVVVNPINGKSVVADIADAGPAAWTGKQFGGSPEVMAALDLNRGMQKGAVLVFFLNEQDHPIAYGPVKPQEGAFIANK